MNRRDAQAAPARLTSCTPVNAGLLQRKCACGGAPGVSGKCEECSRQQLNLQWRADHRPDPAGVPKIVHEVLQSPGQPLDAQARAFMEPRFGHDFSRVRVHTDTKAAESAKAIHAHAYTVQHDVVFGTGQYAPNTPAGSRMLAHELTHVVQQSSAPVFSESLNLAPAHDSREMDAERNAELLSRPASLAPFAPLPETRSVLPASQGISPASMVQRQEQASASSSGSSGSSGGGGGGGTGGGGSAGGSCTIDVRATHIGGVLSGLPIWHLFIVYTDGAGSPSYFRGGPGGSCPGVSGGYGTIISTHGAYVAGTVDWDPSAPSKTVLSGPGACGKDSCFASELSRIDATCTPYAPTGPNSNTVAKTLLSKCGVPKDKPVLIAPGWGDPDL